LECDAAASLSQHSGRSISAQTLFANKRHPKAPRQRRTPNASGARSGALLTTLVSFALAVLLTACDSASKSKSAQPSPAPEKLRQLNEIPIAQLRVMIKGYPGEWRPDSDRSHERPEPPAEKPFLRALSDRARSTLGDPSREKPVREAIAARRSTRDFTDAALSLEELSYLLWATQGVTPCSVTTRVPSCSGSVPRLRVARATPGDLPGDQSRDRPGRRALPLFTQ